MSANPATITDDGLVMTAAGLADASTAHADAVLLWDDDDAILACTAAAGLDRRRWTVASTTLRGAVMRLSAHAV